MGGPYVYLPKNLVDGKKVVNLTRDQLADNLEVKGSVSQTLDNLRAYMGLGGYGSILTNNQIELVKA